MRAILLTLASACCLLGCSTPQERAMQQQAEMDRMIAEFGPACTKLGHAENTDFWRDCILQLASKNENYRGRISTSVFGSWGRWGGSGVGIGIGIGR